LCVCAVESLINRESHITQFCPVLRLIIKLEARNSRDDRKRNRDGLHIFDYRKSRREENVNGANTFEIIRNNVIIRAHLNIAKT
jgi:hypothetical protein